MRRVPFITNYDATQSTGFHQEVLIPPFFETWTVVDPMMLQVIGAQHVGIWAKSLMPYLNGGIFDIDKVVDHRDFDAENQVLDPRCRFQCWPWLWTCIRWWTEWATSEHAAFLDDYHFTIAEDTPVDEAVALDPELMGKIFENLLQ